MQNNIPITKKVFDESLKEALKEQAAVIIEAMDFGFEKNRKEHEEIKGKLEANAA